MNRSTDVWLCHTTKKLNGIQTVASCHLKYHTEMCFETTSTATGSSVASELTEEQIFHQVQYCLYLMGILLQTIFCIFQLEQNRQYIIMYVSIRIFPLSLFILNKNTRTFAPIIFVQLWQKEPKTRSLSSRTSNLSGTPGIWL